MRLKLQNFKQASLDSTSLESRLERILYDMSLFFHSLAHVGRVGLVCLQAKELPPAVVSGEGFSGQLKMWQLVKNVAS